MWRGAARTNSSCSDLTLSRLHSSLQVEALENVERAYVHVDYEMRCGGIQGFPTHGIAFDSCKPFDLHNGMMTPPSSRGGGSIFSRQPPPPPCLLQGLPRAQGGAHTAAQGGACRVNLRRGGCGRDGAEAPRRGCCGHSSGGWAFCVRGGQTRHHRVFSRVNSGAVIRRLQLGSYFIYGRVSSGAK